MSRLVSARVDFSGAEALLGRVSGGFVRRAMSLIVGEAAQLVRRNFMRLNSRRSPQSNFYRREGEAKTGSEVSPDGSRGAVTVASYQMAHKLTGGTVRPVRAKSIAVPITDWAKAVSREQSSRLSQRADLQYVRSRRGKPMLWRIVDGEATEPAFVLLKSVKHKPHPDVLPGSAELTAAAEKAAKIATERL